MKGSVWLWAALAVAHAGVGAELQQTPYLRGVPYFNQYENDLEPAGSCQNTSMAMVLAHYGAPVTPDDITRRWGTERAKTVSGWQDVFNELAEEHGAPVRDTGISDGRISQARRQLASGYPVVVHGKFTSGGHLIVLLGFDGDHYYVHDPAGDWLMGHPSGRHSSYAREPLERTIANASGWVRFHSFRAVPSRPVVVGALADSAVAGETVRIATRLTVIPDDDAVILTADLSALGGPATVPLPRGADGRRALEASFTATGQGLADAVIRNAATGEVIPAGTVAVLAPEDVVIFGDETAAGWSVSAAQGEDPSVTEERAAEGRHSLAVTGEGIALAFQPDTPLPMHGFSALRLAFHPGDAAAVGDSLLAIYVNGDIRGHAVLHGHGAPPRIDPDRRGWQTVEVPMRELAWVEEPLESLHVIGHLAGTVYFDDLCLVAARPCPVAAVWERAPADTLTAGAEIEVAFQTRVTRQGSEGDPPALTADLSALGGAAAAPLRLVEPGLYELRQTLVPPADNGLREARVHVAQTIGGVTHEAVLVHRLVLLPPADHAIFSATLDWPPSYLYNCELARSTDGPDLDGGGALAVTADFFTVDLAAPAPVDPVGYRALRLAFHPGEVAPRSRAAYTLFVNGDERTAVKLMGGDDASVALDLDRREWQVVEIPLEAFGDFGGPIESIRLLGNLAGRFYLDDVRLVAHRPAAAPATAVVEGAAIPGPYALAPCYPNPFNGATTIAFQLPVVGHVDLAIHNALGQRVRRLVSVNLEAGAHRIQWDGRDATGRTAATGVYFARLETPHAAATRSLLLVR